MPTVPEVQVKVAKTVVNMDRLDLFVNGGVDVVVVTDNGTSPSIAGLFQSVRPVYGNGPPSNALGDNGQFYFDITPGQSPAVYGPKTAGSWGARRPLKGDPGGGSGVNVGLLTDIAGEAIPAGTNAVLLDDGYVARATTVSAADVTAFPHVNVRDVNGRGFQRHIVRQEGLRPAIWLSGVAPANASQAADQTAGMDEMIRWGIKSQDHGVIVVGEPGAVYTSENSNALNGLHSLWWRGNGSRLQNGWFGSTADAAQGYAINRQAPAPTNTPSLPNGRELLTYGTGQGAGAGNDMGIKIASAPKGQMWVDSIGGATFRGPGPLLIGSNARYQPGGIPPSFPTFEYNAIIALANSGTRAMLLFPLSQPVERYGPIVNFGTDGNNTDQSGYAMALQLERPDGTFRRSVHPRATIFEDVEWQPNPNWTRASPTDYYPNNQVYFGGGILSVLRRCRMIDLAVGSGKEIVTDQVEVTGVFEVDKNGDDLLISGTFNQIQSASGTKRVKMRQGRSTGGVGLGPIETLDVEDWRFEGSAIDSANAMISTMGMAPAKVRIGKNVVFVPGASTDRIWYGGASQRPATVVDQMTIKDNRAGWDAGVFGQLLYLNAVLYNENGLEVFRVDRLQHCDTTATPNPDARYADVIIGGETVGATLTTGATLRAPYLPDLEMADFRVEGPYANRLTYPLSTQTDTYNNHVGKINVPGCRDGKLTITEKDRFYNVALGAFVTGGGKRLGRAHRVSGIYIDVLSPITASGAQQFILSVDYYNGTSVQVFSLDLKTTGRRRFNEDGTVNLFGADVAGTFPSLPILQAKWTNPAATMAAGARGRMMITMPLEDVAG